MNSSVLPEWSAARWPWIFPLRTCSTIVCRACYALIGARRVPIAPGHAGSEYPVPGRACPARFGDETVEARQLVEALVDADQRCQRSAATRGEAFALSWWGVWRKLGVREDEKQALRFMLRCRLWEAGRSGRSCSANKNPSHRSGAACAGSEARPMPSPSYLICVRVGRPSLGNDPKHVLAKRARSGAVALGTVSGSFCKRDF